MFDLFVSFIILDNFFITANRIELKLQIFLIQFCLQL